MRKTVLSILPILFVIISLSSSVFADQLTAHILVSNQPEGYKSPNMGQQWTTMGSDHAK